MSIDKELGELIKKNLPEATAGALRERLEDLESTEKLYKKAEKTIVKLNDSIDGLKKDINGLESQVLTEDELNTLKKELINQEELLKERETVLFYKEQVLHLKEDHAVIRVNDHKDMFNTVFRNTTLRNNIMDNKIMSTGDMTISTGFNGENIPVKQPDIITPITKTETKTEE